MTDGLGITFDPAIDAGSWPGPRAAEVGRAALGPLRLLDRLETELGLGSRREPPAERVAGLVGALAGRTGWWRGSYEADPRGTCGRLLRDRDLLAMWGWRGEPASPRLAELWAATADASPGIPDRLAAIIAALRPGSLDVAELVTTTALASLEPMWARTLRAVAGSGVPVIEAPPAIAAVADGLDLARLRRSGAIPQGDGSLVLLRGDGPLAVAEELAASLAARGALDGVVVIGGDAALDQALARHGLPRASGDAGAPASGALLRLVVESAFEPIEPGVVLAALALPRSPIARRISWRLRKAFTREPSRRGPAWAAALAAGLAECDEAWRDDAATRAGLLAAAAPPGAEVAIAELDRRLALLAAWAGAREDLRGLAYQAGAGRRLLAAGGLKTIGLTAARRLCDDLEVTSPRRAEAGLAAVRDPGAILGPTPIILWWSFTREAAPGAPRLRLSRAEADGLRARGVTPPDLGAVMEATAARWRRPLEQATAALVLCCPDTSAAGEGSFPHPLWDELSASLAPGHKTAPLERTRLTRPAMAARAPAPAQALPAPRPEIHLAAIAGLELRERESPSSLDKLLGCSLAWALGYAGHLRTGAAADRVAVGPLLLGTLAHALLGRVFADGPLPPNAAAERAAALIEAELASCAEVLTLPRYHAERAAFTRTVAGTARALATLIEATGASLRGFEQTLTGELDGVALTGNADVVLDQPAALLDFKWGRASHRERLAVGGALQLAVYAALLAQTGPRPEAAYLTMARGELFGPADATLPGVAPVGPHRLTATWDGARIALARRRAELAAGVLRAPGADPGALPPRGGLTAEGALEVAPPCQYCELQVICGQGGRA